jgi:hypothetical protein
MKLYIYIYLIIYLWIIELFFLLTALHNMKWIDDKWMIIVKGS